MINDPTRERFGGYADGPYILCYVSGNGTLTPQGNGKCWQYASELLKEYRARGHSNWQIYKMEKVDELVQ